MSVENKAFHHEPLFRIVKRDAIPLKKSIFIRAAAIVLAFLFCALISFILIAILLFGLALGGTILVMNLTKSKDVQIPNLVKNSAGTRLTEAQAVEIYNKTEFKKKNDLKIEYVEDETINGETVEPGQVVKQTPAYVENRKIKAKDQITIYVRKAKEVKTLKMIDLTGKTKEEAESLLKSLGYTGTIKYEEEASDSLKEGLIIRQSIQKDIEFKENADLTITVSSGSDKIDVPNVLGQTEAAARQALEAAGFAVKVETTENNDKSDGIILKQSVMDKAKAGETITITVNKVQKTKAISVTVDISKYVKNGDSDDSVSSSNEDKLRAALASDPDTVVTFFSKLSTNLYNDLTKRMASTSMSSIYTIYNDKQMASEYSTYTTKISDKESEISTWEDYYYNKFSKMESALAKLNQTQSSLSGYFS